MDRARLRVPRNYYVYYGHLGYGDNYLSRDGTFFDKYNCYLSAGRTYRVEVTGYGFRPYIWFQPYGFVSTDRVIVDGWGYWTYGGGYHPGAGSGPYGAQQYGSPAAVGQQQAPNSPGQFRGPGGGGQAYGPGGGSQVGGPGGGGQVVGPTGDRLGKAYLWFTPYRSGTYALVINTMDRGATGGYQMLYQAVR